MKHISERNKHNNRTRVYMRRGDRQWQSLFERRAKKEFSISRFTSEGNPSAQKLDPDLRGPQWLYQNDGEFDFLEENVPFSPDIIEEY